MDRRTFLKTTTLTGASVALAPSIAKLAPVAASQQKNDSEQYPSGLPIVFSTWDFKLPTSDTAIKTLKDGGSAIDAVESAIRVVEQDPKTTSVGRGGYPDRDGHLTLDACIMDSDGNAGSVMFVEHIMHPISVARRVMEKTPHVFLAGDGAMQFALEQGFPKEDLLTKEAEAAYKEWLAKSHYKPAEVNEHNHDTIGLIVMDEKGDLAGGCSTSGAAWKLHGRVGDSPIIGAGLYVDNEVGAATSTGWGEAVIKIAGSFLIVELMRNGASPQEACQKAIERMIQKQPKYKEMEGFLVGFIAINKRGEVGACSYRKGLQYTLYRNGINKIVDADFLVK